jgi:uncharacterized membrane protein YgdD (TMEM256/DUF423 family)
VTLQPQAKRALLTGSILLAVAVLIGAFGAHGLKNLVTPEKLVTFETGVRYHFYHALGLMLLGLFQQVVPGSKSSLSFFAFLLGILIFSFNCYLYVLTGMRFFAMIVPIGGVSFVVGWIGFARLVLKAR